MATKPNLGAYAQLITDNVMVIVAWRIYAVVDTQPATDLALFLAIVLTLNAISSWLSTPTKLNVFDIAARWSDRRFNNYACKQAVDTYRALDRIRTGTPDPAEEAHLNNQLQNIREILCGAHGWDRATEADDGGRADQHIRAWWSKRYPQDFRLHG